MKKIIWVVLLAIVACQNNQIDGESNEVVAENKDSKNNKPLVSVVEIKSTSFKDYFHTQGSVVSKEIAFIKPEINGSVKAIHVSEGDYVAKGDPIVTISIDLLTAQVAELNEQISFAQYLFKKQQSLFEDGVSTEIQLKEMESNLKRTIKAKNTLLTQVEKGKVLAPFNGYVEELSVKLGESISPMNSICQLVNTDQLFVEADVSENLLSEVKKGDPLSVYFPSLGRTKC
jgi:membrane fusion protein (multidrug efflux system)